MIACKHILSAAWRPLKQSIDTVYREHTITACHSHWTRPHSWFMRPWKAQLPSRLVAAVIPQRENWRSLHLRDRSYQLCSLMYGMSSQLKACWVCVLVECKGSGIGYPSKLSLPSLFFSLCLIAWAWGKVLIMFSFIQTINPEAQCTRVPPRETSHIWQRLCYYHHSLWVTGAPFLLFFYPEVD